MMRFLGLWVPYILSCNFSYSVPCFTLQRFQNFAFLSISCAIFGNNSRKILSKFWDRNRCDAVNFKNDSSTYDHIQRIFTRNTSSTGTHWANGAIQNCGSSTFKYSFIPKSNSWPCAWKLSSDKVSGKLFFINMVLLVCFDHKLSLSCYKWYLLISYFCKARTQIKLSFFKQKLNHCDLPTER